MNIIYTIELLAPKIVKIIIESTLNGKGYMREADSRTLLIQYFSDIVFINSKYDKLRQKGKLRFTLELDRILTDRCSNRSDFQNTSYFKRNEELNVEHKSDEEQ